MARKGRPSANLPMWWDYTRYHRQAISISPMPAPSERPALTDRQADFLAIIRRIGSNAAAHQRLAPSATLSAETIWRKRTAPRVGRVATYEHRSRSWSIGLGWSPGRDCSTTCAVLEKRNCWRSSPSMWWLNRQFEPSKSEPCLRRLSRPKEPAQFRVSLGQRS